MYSKLYWFESSACIERRTSRGLLFVVVWQLLCNPIFYNSLLFDWWKQISIVFKEIYCMALWCFEASFLINHHRLLSTMSIVDSPVSFWIQSIFSFHVYEMFVYFSLANWLLFNAIHNRSVGVHMKQLNIIIYGGHTQYSAVAHWFFSFQRTNAHFLLFFSFHLFFYLFTGAIAYRFRLFMSTCNRAPF